MIWVTGIAIMLLLIIFLALLSVIVTEIDTRVPQVIIRWGLLAKITIWFKDEWWLCVQLPFFERTIRLAGRNKTAVKEKRIIASKREAGRVNFTRITGRFFKVLKTFRVTEWSLHVDTGDYVWNAQLYLLNLMPNFHNHVYINFRGENFFVIKARNYPWRILYAFLR